MSSSGGEASRISGIGGNGSGGGLGAPVAELDRRQQGLSNAQVRLFNALSSASEQAVRRHAQLRGVSSQGHINLVIQRILQNYQR